MEKSRQLQRNLYLVAKKDKQRRFHALYDRIFRLDILWQAWKEVRANKGSAGIDGITFEMIEEYGVEEYLLDIQEELQNKEYRPKPVKRVYIPKPDGKQRPLAIPTIRDRIVQQLEKLKHKQYVAERKLTAAKHREKRLESEMKRLTRSERTHRLCTRAGML